MHPVSEYFLHAQAATQDLSEFKSLAALLAAVDEEESEAFAEPENESDIKVWDRVGA